MNCVACGSLTKELDHIKTKGSGAGNESYEVWPLCRSCHTEKGKSLVKFVEKNPHLNHELTIRGWTLTNIFGVTKLRRL